MRLTAGAQPLINKQVTCYEANLRALLEALFIMHRKLANRRLPLICVHVPKKHCRGREKDEYLLLYLGLFIAYNIMTKPERGWEYAERCIGWSLRTNTLKRYRFSCDMVEALKYETRPESLVVAGGIPSLSSGWNLSGQRASQLFLSAGGRAGTSL